MRSRKAGLRGWASSVRADLPFNVVGNRRKAFEGDLKLRRVDACTHAAADATPSEHSQAAEEQTMVERSLAAGR